jgi:hypothetical protein
MQYEEYCRGLSFLKGRTPPETIGDVALAERVLSRLYSAYVAAGRNTFEDSRAIYEAAAQILGTFPGQCTATLDNVDAACERLAHGDSPFCEPCTLAVRAAMHRQLLDVDPELLNEVTRCLHL